MSQYTPMVTGAVRMSRSPHQRRPGRETKLNSSSRVVILNINGSVQDCSIISALAMETQQSCTKPSVCGINESLLTMRNDLSNWATYCWEMRDAKLKLFFFKSALQELINPWLGQWFWRNVIYSRPVLTILKLEMIELSIEISLVILNDSNQ